MSEEVDTTMSRLRTAMATIGLAGTAAAGFLVPPRPSRATIDFPPAASGPLELPPGLPDGFRRYAHAVFGDAIPSFETAVIRGRARMRPLLRGPWLHCRMATNHRLGRAFAAEFAITWFGMSTLRSADAFIDGHGVVERFGRIAPEAPAYDQSAAMFMWLEAGMFPQTWHLPGLTFGQPDETTLELGIPDAEDVLTWRLDVATGLPTSVEAPRYREVDGPKIAWRAELGRFRDYGGLRWWTSAAAIWEDQGEPWLEWTIDDVVPGAPVDAALERHAGDRSDAPSA